MRLYTLYALLVASILIASIAAVPGLNDRLRRWLIVAVSVLVIVPGLIFLLFKQSASALGYPMNDFVLVLVIAGCAAFLTWLGVPLAERFEVPHRMVRGHSNLRSASSRPWW